VIVVGVVEGIQEVRFERVDGNDVEAVGGPQIQPGLEFAVIQHVGFLPDEGTYLGDQIRIHDFFPGWLVDQAVINFFHC
jgi:hypothetical protein